MLTSSLKRKEEVKGDSLNRSPFLAKALLASDSKHTEALRRRTRNKLNEATYSLPHTQDAIPKAKRSFKDFCASKMAKETSSKLFHSSSHNFVEKSEGLSPNNPKEKQGNSGDTSLMVLPCP